MPHLLVENVHKVYSGAEGGVAALRGVSFRAERGDFIALCGPSGCGKSTLLHIVGAMDRPSEGRVELNGRELHRLTRHELALARRREVGFVFQAFHLLPTLRVWENVALPLTLDGVSRSAARQRAEELLDRVQLAHRSGSLPAQLSGGELQRAAVARAVVAGPAVLLADEPTGSLDSENGTRVLELLRELNQERRLTILLATHAPEAARYAQRTLRMRDGRILAVESQHAELSQTV